MTVCLLCGQYFNITLSLLMITKFSLISHFIEGQLMLGFLPGHLLLHSRNLQQSLMLQLLLDLRIHDKLLSNIHTKQNQTLISISYFKLTTIINITSITAIVPFITSIFIVTAIIIIINIIGDAR